MSCAPAVGEGVGHLGRVDEQELQRPAQRAQSAAKMTVPQTIITGTIHARDAGTSSWGSAMTSDHHRLQPACRAAARRNLSAAICTNGLTGRISMVSKVPALMCALSRSTLPNEQVGQGEGQTGRAVQEHDLGQGEAAQGAGVLEDDPDRGEVEARSPRTVPMASSAIDSRVLRAPARSQVQASSR